jgi:hypothetical protein
MKFIFKWVVSELRFARLCDLRGISRRSLLLFYEIRTLPSGMPLFIQIELLESVLAYEYCPRN